VTLEALHPLLHQSQPQAAARLGPGIRSGHPIKALEQAGQLVGRDLSGVADPELNPFRDWLNL